MEITQILMACLAPARLKRFLALACILACAALVLVAPARGQSPADMPIYTDSLQNGWQNWSWATVNLAETSVVYSGSDAIGVTFTANSGLYLEHSSMSTAGYSAITFWLNGGSTGGQQFQIQALSNNSPLPAVPISKYVPGGSVPANQWVQVMIPLSDLGAANLSTFTGFWLQDTTGGNQPAMYVDQIVLTSATPPAVVNVSINDAATVQTVDERAFGVNTAAWDADMDTANAKSLMSAAGVRALRYPGGSWSDGTYHWYQQAYSGEPMTPQFADLAGSLNDQVFITADYGDGTPQSNAAWLAYCNALPTSTVQIGTDSNGVNWQTAGYWASIRAAAPLAVDDGYNFLRANHAAPYSFKNWEIGNECYGNWENDTHTPQWDPVVYANFTKQAISLMKQVDPTVKIGVVITASEDDSGDQAETVTNPVTGVTHKGWTAVLFSTLNSLGVVPDFVIYHNYVQNPGSENDSLLLQASSDWASLSTSIQTMLKDYFGATSAGGVQLICTENNSVSFDPGKQTTSLVNGLYLADSIGALLETPFKALVWWDMHNGADSSENNSSSLYGWRQYGDYGILATQSSLPGSAQDTPYPAYFGTKLLSHFARNGDEIVQATSSYADLSVYACQQQSGTLALLVINKHPTANLNATFALSGFTPAGSATVYQYGTTQDTAQSQGQTVDLAQSSATGLGSSFNMTFPAYSMTVISLAPQPATPPAGTQTVQIDCGGGAVGSFSADKEFSGGSTWSTVHAVTTSGVANAAPAAAYQSQRYGNFSYPIGGLTPGAQYAVRLHFAETWFGTSYSSGGAGSRKFDVAINGQQVLTNFDVFATSGGANKALVEPFTAIANSSGAIVIQFTSVVSNAMVEAIEVVPPATGGTTTGGTSGPAPGTVLAQIDAGGGAVGTFSADKGYSGGSTWSTTAAISTTGVANAAPMAVYQTQRYGTFSYSFGGLTPGASYTVRLHFAESWFGPGMPGGGGKGNRVFNVSVNGASALTNFDVFATAGGSNKALVETITTTANSAGVVTVQFTPVVTNAMVEGLELIAN